MDTIENVARAARHVMAEHGKTAKNVALARAKSAAESNRDDVAPVWRHIAVAVQKMEAAESRAAVPRIAATTNPV
jgi:hypothetical protein